MGLRHIVRMLSLSNIKILHIEPTDACNAACPQCARETDTTFNKNDLHHLTVDQIKKLVDEDFIRNLDKMFMCGVYGDPAAGKHTLEIFKYFRSINSTIVLGMNTNGGLRSASWWKELATICNQPQDYVVWSIDGLEDTNHIYRVNTDWNKIIKNATTFIQAGGSAHWEMLVFDHNQHQIELAKQLAKQSGFNWFRAKVSKRFDSYPVEFLNKPQGWQDPIVTKGEISCHALVEQSLYISANGIMFPCCWMATTNFTINQFNSIQQSWSSNPNKICVDTCIKSNTGTSFSNQWQHEINLAEYNV